MAQPVESEMKVRLECTSACDEHGSTPSDERGLREWKAATCRKCRARPRRSRNISARRVSDVRAFLTACGARA
jgi:hypothetical protein